MTADRVMSSPPILIGMNATLLEAAKVMLKHNIGCLPVVDDMGRFAGIITERTFQVQLAGVKPNSALPPDQRLFEELFVNGADGLSPVQEKFLHSKNIRVEEVMVSGDLVVAPDTPLWQVAELLLVGHLSHIAVVDHGKPVGVIARHDLMRAYVLNAENR
jgi:CBS domain-containing protein